MSNGIRVTTTQESQNDIITGDMFKLNLALATKLSDGSFSWDTSRYAPTYPLNRAKLDTVCLSFSWFLFMNVPLAFTGGSPVLNGSPDINDLPAKLALLFGAISCTIDPDTRLINLQFAAPTTLFVSQWGKTTAGTAPFLPGIRAQYYLGSGLVDLPVGGPSTSITFPEGCDLSGDKIVNMRASFNSQQTTTAGSNLSDEFDLSINIDGNPFDIVYYTPDNYYFVTRRDKLGSVLNVKFLDIWGNVLTPKDGYIQFRAF